MRRKMLVKAVVITATAVLLLLAGLLLLRNEENREYAEHRDSMTEGFGQLKTVSWKNRKKGDLIFYSKHGVVIHIAIYIGKGKIIHSWPGRVQISRARNSHYGHLCKVKRVFL